MKCLKTLSLLAVAVTALTGFAGTASATLTSPTGTPYTGEIATTATNFHLTGSVKLACKHSSITPSVTAGATTGVVSTLAFTECAPDTWPVLKKGHLTIAEGVGGVISSGAEITLLTHRTILGFSVTTHCIYSTYSAAEGGTSIGTITDSHVTGGHAVIDINGQIPRLPTDSACGEDPAIWTGTYTVTKPALLYVD